MIVAYHSFFCISVYGNLLFIEKDHLEDFCKITILEFDPTLFLAESRHLFYWVFIADLL